MAGLAAWRIFAVNPGSTSTKLALLNVAEGQVQVLKHSEFSHQASGTLDLALTERSELVKEQAKSWQPFAAIAARGGLIGPVPAGSYVVDEALIKASLAAPAAGHPANLGAPLALELSRIYGVPAYVVDPPSVDEMLPLSRVSGVPGVERRSLVHALNLRYVARKLAAELGQDFLQSTLIGAHLGGGSSTAIFHHGRMIDSSDALLGEGPFSPNRAGSVPVHGVLELLENYGLAKTQELLARHSGFLGLLGTQDLRELSGRLDEPEVKLVVKAYALSVTKALLALAAHARPQALFLTGGAVNFKPAVELIHEHLSWLVPLYLFPGEFEMEALALGVWRVLSGLEPARSYAA